MQDKPDNNPQADSSKIQAKDPTNSSSVQKPVSLMTALIILVSISSGFLGGWLGADSRSRDSIDKATTEARQHVVSSESELISEIAKNTGAGVVSIDVTSQAAAGFGFFGFAPVEQQSAGTGFIINEEGIILTNRHVIPDGVSSVSITLADGTQLTDVEVIGKTSASDSLDVAFLKIRDAKGKKLSPVRIGDSSKVKVGEKVVAIGNALGQFQNTVTSGIISGYGRSLIAGNEEGGGETLQNLFQTDAAINQGNSGGPLVNMSGDVIAINTAVAGGRAENLGFAIPIDDVKGLIKSVLTKGKLERPYLGVRYVNLTDDYAYQYNLPQKRGAYILPNIDGRVSILPNSPAAKAGLQEKDIITKIDSEEIDENHSLISLIGRHSVGDEVTLTYIRDGKEDTVKVVLDAAPTG
jgi:serine protease Do